MFLLHNTKLTGEDALGMSGYASGFAEFEGESCLYCHNLSANMKSVLIWGWYALWNLYLRPISGIDAIVWKYIVRKQPQMDAMPEVTNLITHC